MCARQVDNFRQGLGVVGASSGRAADDKPKSAIRLNSTDYGRNLVLAVHFNSTE